MQMIRFSPQSANNAKYINVASTETHAVILSAAKNSKNAGGENICHPVKSFRFEMS